jgi:hypothetical protein
MMACHVSGSAARLASAESDMVGERIFSLDCVAIDGRSSAHGCSKNSTAGPKVTLIERFVSSGSSATIYAGLIIL